MNPKLDLISVGDTQHDVFLELEEETKLIHDEAEQRDYLGLVFAEKIPTKNYKSIVGVGNSANVAVGASRLGLHAAFYTHLGEDTVGRAEFELLKQEKIATDYVVWDKKHGSNFSAVLNYKGERTILVHHEPRDYNLPNLANTKWLYFSSVAPDHGKLNAQIPEYVKQYSVKLGFNPGSYQLEEGLEVLSPVLRATTVFLVNKEEAQTLLGDSTDIKELLRGLKGTGPEIVVITDDGKGSYCFDGVHFYYLDIFHVPIVEMTGAGDAYATGFISALIHGNDVKEAMRWGAMNGASVIQKIGAREGLLRKNEMEAILGKNLTFQPAII